LGAMMDRHGKAKLKICIVGEKGVGKTSLLNRYVFNTFGEPPKTTSGTKMSLVSLKRIEAGGRTVDVEVALFDLMGETAIRDAFKEVLFWGAHGFIAVADATNSDTLRALPSWVQVVRSISGEIPFHILANKADLLSSGKMRTEDAVWLSSRFPKTVRLAVSAKSGIGVENGFNALIKAAIENIMAKSMVRTENLPPVGDLGGKILSIAKRRSPIGVAKKDLLLIIKNVDHDTLMAEIENLRKNGLATIELTGPASFIVKITEKGEKQLVQIVRH